MAERQVEAFVLVEVEGLNSRSLFPSTESKVQSVNDPILFPLCETTRPHMRVEPRTHLKLN